MRAMPSRAAAGPSRPSGFPIRVRKSNEENRWQSSTAQMDVAWMLQGCARDRAAVEDHRGADRHPRIGTRACVESGCRPGWASGPVGGSGHPPGGPGQRCRSVRQDPVPTATDHRATPQSAEPTAAGVDEGIVKGRRAPAAFAAATDRI
jgi:hypothetical protein